MRGRRYRWLDHIRRTCGSGSWRRWGRAPRPRRRPAGSRAGAPPPTPGRPLPPRGGGPRRFAVGRSPAYRWATAARLEGRRAAKRMGGGPKPRITGEVEAALLDLLREANHLTLAECRDRLAERTGVRVHPWTGGRALRRGGRAGKKRTAGG